MTVLCSGGASAAKAGVPGDIALTTSAVAALLNNVPTAWAVPLAGALGLLSYHLATFCATDPPGYPTFSAGDWLLIYTADPSPDGHAARQKLIDTIDTYLWYQMCECSSTTTPSAPAAPSAPSDAPSVNPPQVGPAFSPGAPCATYSFVGNSAETAVAGGEVEIPIGAVTLITMHIDGMPSGLLAHDSFGVNLNYLSAAHAPLGGATVGISTFGRIQDTSTPPPTGTAFYKFAHPTATGYSPPFSYTLTANAYCGTGPGSSGGPIPLPCLPDPMVQIMLSRILDLLTLVQRQSVPFAYIAGTTHSALTGTGTVSVSGILGLLVNLSLPAHLSLIGGTPDVRLPIGRLNLGTADGYRDRLELVTADQVFFPADAGVYTIVGYSLEDGVTMSLTELVREP
jgi:hypothetical protein